MSNHLKQLLKEYTELENHINNSENVTASDYEALGRLVIDIKEEKKLVSVYHSSYDNVVDNDPTGQDLDNFLNI